MAITKGLPNRYNVRHSPILPLKTPPLVLAKATTTGLHTIVNHTTLAGTDTISDVGKVGGRGEADTTHRHTNLVNEGGGGLDRGEEFVKLSLVMGRGGGRGAAVNIRVLQPVCVWTRGGFTDLRGGGAK